MNRVELEEMGESCWVREVIYADNLDVSYILENSEDHSADSAESVNGYTSCHYHCLV